MEKKTNLSKEDFMKKNYITCKICGYNNERGRLMQYGTCLKCGKILDEKTYFMIQMMKKVRENKRKTE